jgi:hypothetical protein
MKLGKITAETYYHQAAEILSALKKLGEKVTLFVISVIP